MGVNDRMAAVTKGFKFGMLLQLAIGPICLLIFKMAGSKSFAEAMIGVSAVVLVDSLFILLAILGIASFVGRERVKKVFNCTGAVIVGIFGLATILDVFGVSLIPGLGMPDGLKSAGSFIEAFVLTAANPLTILFWAGVFTTRLAEGKLSGNEVYLFGFGSALSTLISLTVVAVIGTMTKTFLPRAFIDGLNVIIGIVLILFAVRMLVGRRNTNDNGYDKGNRASV
jgi:threonine/homoserine/homoserine lactone efflux protein